MSPAEVGSEVADLITGLRQPWPMVITDDAGDVGGTEVGGPTCSAVKVDKEAIDRRLADRRKGETAFLSAPHRWWIRVHS